MRPHAPPMPDRLPAGAAVQGLLRELAAVREVELAEGLGPERLAALARLEARATAARRRRRLLCAMVSAAALVALSAAALAHWLR